MTTRSVVLICLVFQAAAPGIVPCAASPTDLKCIGEPHRIGEPHIVGGEEVKPHSHPHQVGLLLNPFNLNEGFCGGSLLSEIWVVTAAHCTDFKYITEVQIIAGAHRIKEKEEMTQHLQIDKVYQHPDFDKSKSKDDISLIRLSTPAKLSEYIQPIRLPSQEQKNNWFWRQEVTITGWGSVSDQHKEVTSALRGVQTKTISNFCCKFCYLFLQVYSSNICASGFNWKGTCYGDSGGPMTIKESDGIRTLIGVSSYGSGFGCEKLWPTVFTRITYYLDWIHTTTGIPERT